MIFSMPAAAQALLFDLPEVPKRQKTKWEELQEMAEVSQTEQGLVPPIVAAALLNLSKQRIAQLRADGAFRTFEFFGKPYLSIREIRGFIDVERASGRPWHEPSAKELWKRSLNVAKK